MTVASDPVETAGTMSEITSAAMSEKEQMNRWQKREGKEGEEFGELDVRLFGAT